MPVMSDIIEKIEVAEANKLSDYSAYANLANSVYELKNEASVLMPFFKDRTIYMLNSTAKGGGVAEMLPRYINIFRELGVNIEWLVMHPDQEAFFSLTKNLHNLIHGAGSTDIASEEKKLYNRVSRKVADGIKPYLKENDILVVHDPQPMGAGALLKKETGVTTLWRCHIGLDKHTEETRAAWHFLSDYADPYDHGIFTASEYIPSYFAGKSSIIYPSLDPLSHKSRVLSAHKLMGILCNAGLGKEHEPVLTPPFSEPAMRLQPDGSFQRADEPEEIGLMYRPTITQVSRWDRLKGFKPLMDGFIHLKKNLINRDDIPERHRNRLKIVRLVMAGPDPSSIQDDPEGIEVLQSLIDTYKDLEPEIQKDIALLTLPMNSSKENALMVNAIQRCSTVIAQNSLKEGFGLTATEAMFKAIPVIGTSAVGLRLQIRDQIDGLMVQNPEDPIEIAEKLDTILSEAKQREFYAINAQKRIHDEFLLFKQIARWLRVLYNTANGYETT